MSAVRFLTAAVLLAALGVFVTAAPVPPQKSDDRELHVVCHERRRPGDATDKTTIKVDRPGKDVTLVLGGNQDVAWNVSVTDSTRLVKVILIGRVKQTVGELPKTVEVVEAFPDRQNPVPRPYILVGEDPSDAYFRPMIRQLHS